MTLSRKIGVFVIILIIIVIATILLAPVLSNKYDYISPTGEKFTFTKNYAGNVQIHVLTAYVTYLNDDKKYIPKYIPFRYGPKSLENIPVESGINNKLLNKKFIYITRDPNVTSEITLASIEIAKVIGTADYGVFKIPTKGAITRPISNVNPDDIPIITCGDADKETGVILLSIGSENSIYSAGECVVVESKNNSEIIKVADRLVYNLLGVM